MILASRSPRRIALLAELGLKARSVPADVDESPLPGEAPEDLVARLARSKARAVLARDEAAPGELVVAADTVVWTEGGRLGKPADDADAARMLRRLSGRSHQVSTGVCLLAADEAGAPARERGFVETTEVSFYPLSDEDVAAYVASGEPRDKAGAYGIQGLGRVLVRGIVGDYYNVVGLPVARLVRELRSLGAELPGAQGAPDATGGTR